MNKKAIKVLLIEDRAGDRLLMEEMLSEARGIAFALVCAPRLIAGLKRLAKEDIDVVLLDLSLPDSLGLDTFIAVHTQAPEVPVIVLTGLEDEEMGVQAVREGAQDYLFKGQIDSNLLSRAIRYAIERKQTEEMLRQQTVALQSRNAELDAFAHTVAHDLKSPLGPIISFTTLLLHQYDKVSDEKRRQYLRYILESGQKMSNIIDALLLLAQVNKTEIEMEPLDMSRIVTEAQRRMAWLIERHEAELVICDAWPLALGYAPWVEEVWINYISNAIKYGGNPPRVELGATLVPREDAVSVTGRVGDRVRFWVRDNGPGLTLEDQTQLFVPFTRLDKVRTQGYGLGLSIVQRIVEKLGGEVGVDSNAGQGCVFSFTLPRALE